MSELFPRNSYLINATSQQLPIARGETFSADLVLDGIDGAHALLDQFKRFDVDVFGILGMRNLSAFVGELVAASIVKAANGRFAKNPHQDGYPDLLLMDPHGLALWDALQDRRREKAPFRVPLWE